MIAFFILIGLYLGLNFKHNFLLIILLSIIIFIFIIKRYSKKIGVIFLSFLISSIGYSYISFDIKSDSFQGIVVEAKENYFLLHTGLENFYIYEKENSREIGDIIKVSGEKREINFSVLESDFDFNIFLKNKGVKYELEIFKITDVFKCPIRIKSSVNKFLNTLDENSKQIVGKLLFNISDDNPLLDNMESLQLFRLISMSGLFLYSFQKFFTFVLSLFFKKRYAEKLSLLLMSPYLILGVSKFSVRKFIIFSILRMINNMFKDKKISYLSLISILGISYLLLNKTYAYQDSFLLSFAVPILIYLIRPYFSQNRKIVNYLKLSFAIYLFFIPFTLKYYHGISIFSFFYQITLTPLFIFLSIVSLLTLYKLPISLFLQGICSVYSNLSTVITHINPVIHIAAFNGILTFIYYFIYFIFLYLYCINFKPLYVHMLITSIAMGFIYIVPFENMITTSVSFINVGQGDSTLIRKGNTTILIDTGGLTYKDVAKDCLIPYFKKNRIYDIDVVILTHDDNDHVGALPSLKENFIVKKTITDKDDFPITINGIEINNLNDKTWVEDNENSLVLSFELSNIRYLIMGDASVDVEKYIISNYEYVGCDILRVGHHGSNTSTSEEFVKFVNPDTAIISVGSNFYGHPSSDVISILKRNNIEIRRTDIEGTITYKNYIFM